MKFYCYTNYGARIEVDDAKDPEDARRQIKAVHPEAKITKIKVAGGQPKQPKQHAGKNHA